MKLIKLIIKIMYLFFKVLVALALILIGAVLMILLLDRFDNEINLANIQELLESPATSPIIAIVFGILTLYFNKKNPIVLDISTKEENPEIKVKDKNTKITKSKAKSKNSEKIKD